MYRIIKTDGTELGIVETPTYIKVTASGCFAPTDKDSAVGVAYQSTAYNLFGSDAIADAETVIVSEVDGGGIFVQATELEAAITEGVNEV